MDTSVEFSICPNHGCGRSLSEGPDGEPFWCDECCQAFELDRVRKASLWRKLSLDERTVQIEQLGAGAIDKFGILESQYQDAINTAESRKAARVLFVADVSPEKATLTSLARTISDVGALREMIDNATDSAQKKELRTPVTVSIRLNTDDGSVIVRDDAGGMNAEDLLRCLRLGASEKEHEENTIGRFGVGAKEAIYHFGREVIIKTREKGSSHGLRVEIPATWLDSQGWNVEVQAVDDVNEGSTEIRIGALAKFDFSLGDQIIPELWDTYQKKIKRGRLSILINDLPVAGPPDPDLLYPPEIYPREYTFETVGVTVDLSVRTLRDAPRQSGIFFYVFGRRYAHWFWNDLRARMIFEKVPQHKLNTHFRVDIDFSGKIDDVPINANKDEVETNGRVFLSMAKMVKRLCDPYLGSISFLSGEGMMRYVDRFAGPENAHPSAKLGGPAFTIGKIYEGMQIDKKDRADVDRFKETILEEIRVARQREVTSGVAPLSTDGRRESNGAVSPFLEIQSSTVESSAGSEVRGIASAQGASIRVKIQSEDLNESLLRKLQSEFARVSERLNVGIQFID